MDKHQFLELMNLPEQWDSMGMYPEELAKIQMAGYVKGHENASEHDRNGAFHWWLKREPSYEALKKLMFLASIDPDKDMGDDVRKYIRLSENYTDQVELSWVK